jgi:pimeloyl-ACP methyl ester carboxylesterase
MGGMVATRFTLQFPEKVEKLILENSTTVYANCNVDSRLNAVTSYTSA